MIALDLVLFNDLEALGQLLVDRATKFILGVILDVLAEFHLRIVVASEQHCDAHHQRFFFDVAASFLRNNPAQQLHHIHLAQHILSISYQNFEGGPVIRFPLYGTGGTILVFTLDDFPNDLQTLGS